MKRPLACFCLLFIFAVWLMLYAAGPPNDPYDEFEGKMISLSGTVEKKEIKSDSEAVYLKNVSLTDSSGFSGETNQNLQLDKGIVCYMPKGDAAPMGSCVIVTGKIVGFRHASNPGEFDMKKYQLYNGYGAMMRQCVWEETDGYFNARREWLWKTRCRLGESISSVLDEKDAGVIRAMILGDKSELAADIKTLYGMSGIAHVLAISGLHISIIGISLYKSLRKAALPVTPSAVISGFIMFNYAQMTGAGTSTVRAVTMFVIMVTADIVRRSYDLPTALAISAFMTVIVNPYELMQSGFWMSYLAVAGVAVFGKTVKDGIEIDNKIVGKVIEALVSGVCVTAFTMPVTALSYYEIPVYSVFLNLIVIPLMTVVLIFGVLSMFVGLIFIPAGIVIAYPCHLILSLYEYICMLSDRLPFSHYICGAPGALQIIICYGLFMMIIFTGKKIETAVISNSSKITKRLIIIAAALLILLFKVPHGFRISVLDVGQGDCICVDSDSLVCMIDGGSSSDKDIFTYKIKPFLKHEGISKVDLWFVTHPDKDHISGLVDMLSADDMGGLQIGSIVLPDAAKVVSESRELIALADKQEIGILFFSVGDGAYSGTGDEDLHILCLHPSKGFRSDDINSYSLVLEITYGDFSGIFTGDAEVESEKAILESLYTTGVAEKMRNPNGGYDVLKVGHHGSSTSSSKEWLEFVAPDIAIISCGRNNPYGHPHAEVLERLDSAGAHICRTDQGGCITINVTGEAVRVIPFLE